jgi:hypothetical protein
MPIPRGRKGVNVEMEKFREGKLHSGSKHGPVVTDPMQAVAISYRQAGMPKKRKRSPAAIGRRVKKGGDYKL